MNNVLSGISVNQLKQAVAIREKIDALELDLASILGTIPTPSAPAKRKVMSAAAKAKISAAQRARWAQRKGLKAPKVAAKPKRFISAAGRAKLAALAKARWAKLKAAGQKSL